MGTEYTKCALSLYAHVVGKSLQYIVHTVSTPHEMCENTEKGDGKMSDKEFLLKALNVIIFSILTISFVAQVKDQVKNISAKCFLDNFCPKILHLQG